MAPLLCSVRSGFTALVNNRAPHITSAPCVLHQHALASKALPEYLKIISKDAIERANFIRARHGLVFSKWFIKMNWLIFSASVTFPNFDVLDKEFPTLSKHAYEATTPFPRQGSLHWWPQNKTSISISSQGWHGSKDDMGARPQPGTGKPGNCSPRNFLQAWWHSRSSHETLLLWTALPLR